MKKLIILTLILSNICVNAQSLIPTKYGVKAGVNIASISSVPNEGVKNIDDSQLIGVSGGFYMEIPITDKWYINPEVVYVQKGASFDYDFIHDYDINEGERDEHNTTNELKLAYIELNPTISYKTSSRVSLNFGPSVAFLIQSDYIASETNTSEMGNLHEELEKSIYTEESLDVGLNLGFSYYLSEDLFFDAKVNTGFMKIGEVSQEIHRGDTSNNTRSNIFELKNRAIVFSLGYLF